MNEIVNKTNLKNGIRILTKKLPYFNSVSMGVWVDVGARDESISENGGENGLAHFIEHMIFKGTSKRTSFEIAKEFDAIGGHTNAFTSMENTCYYAKVIDSHLDTMVDILSDIFLNSVFAKKEIEKERSIILQEIGMIEDNPEDYIHFLSAKTFFGNHPLGRSILGSKENILKFDSKSIKEFFYKFYHPKRIVITATGNVDHNKLVDLIGKDFESITDKTIFPDRKAPKNKKKIDVINRDIEQVHILLNTKGISTTDPKRFAMSLLNTILGGNMSSKLFQDIREKNGLAYSVYAYANSYFDTGLFGIYLACDPKNVFKSTELVLKNLKAIKDKVITETELTHAKEFIKGNLLLSMESVDSQMVRLAQNEINFKKYIDIKKVINKIEKVTLDEINDLALSIFKSEYLCLTVLGPVENSKNFSDMLVI